VNASTNTVTSNASSAGALFGLRDAGSLAGVGTGATMFGSAGETPVEAGTRLRALDGLTGDRRVSDAIVGNATGEVSAKTQADAGPAPEVCRIEVRYTPVAGGIANHAFVVTSDRDSTSYFRGGPSARTAGSNSGSSNSGTSGSDASQSSQGNRNVGVWGTIVTEHGAYGPRTIDWTTAPSGQQDVARVPGNCDQIDRTMGAAADDIARANISYGPLGPNSNSTAREILERAGFPNVQPVVTVPSWNIQLPPAR